MAQTVTHNGTLAAGPAAYAKRICRRALRLLYYRTTSEWFYRPLDRPIRPTAAPRDIMITFLKDDRARLVEWLKENHPRFPWMYLPGEIRLAESDRHIFVIFTRHDKIIGYIKVGVNNVYVHDFNMVVPFPPRSAFVYDTFVLPEHRGRGVALHGLTETLRHMKEAGYGGLWCHIEEWNTASLKTFQKAGFIRKGRIGFFRTMGLSVFLTDGYRPSRGLQGFLGRGMPASSKSRKGSSA